MAETTRAARETEAQSAWEARLLEANGMKHLWQPQEPVSPEEYLRRERLSLEKSEYYGGRPHPLYRLTNEHGEPMPGATRNHNHIASNIHGELYAALQGTDCLAFGGDMRIAAKPGGGFYYADAVVVCGREQYVEGQPQANLLNPTLIVEVLSPSTEQKDRGEKFEMYRMLDSLREYVLVAQDRRSVEVFRKNEAGRWELFAFDEAAETVELASVGAALEMEALYERVGFKPEHSA